MERAGESMVGLSPPSTTMGSMARLFVAVWPTPDVIEALCALRRKDERGVRFVRPENWHITLRFLGEAHPADVAERLDAVGLDAGTARLGPAIDLLGGHSVIVPTTGMLRIAEQVVGATTGLGTAPQRRRYVGHLTLARMRKGARAPQVTGQPFDRSFDVTEIALVQSRLKESGAEYETLATWPAE
jgi:2'-5' RNA ligase